ncbi:hypothetical protein DA718_29060 [Klebsiella huaxiensis]|nr:hypothetical protein DA718_29060 [Klebsiella huaxiensis]
MFAGKKSAQIREILISESAWEEMTCLFAPSLTGTYDLTFASDFATYGPQPSWGFSMHKKSALRRSFDSSFKLICSVPLSYARGYR